MSKYNVSHVYTHVSIYCITCITCLLTSSLKLTVDQTPRVWKYAHRSSLVDGGNGEVIARRSSLVDGRNDRQNRSRRAEAITDDACIKRTEIEGLARTRLREFCSKMAEVALE